MRNVSFFLGVFGREFFLCLRKKGKHWLPNFRSKSSGRWWFQRFFLFSPLLGEDFQFEEHIFQMGWFNHQLESSGRWWFYSARLWGKWSKFEELLFVFFHLHFFLRRLCVSRIKEQHMVGFYVCIYSIWVKETLYRQITHPFSEAWIAITSSCNDRLCVWIVETKDKPQLLSFMVV